MLATLRRTAASSWAGRTSARCSSAKADAASIRPAAWSCKVVSATSGPQSECSRVVSASARWLSSAATPGSDGSSARAASRRTEMAARSPGSALVASWAATSVGSAPAASRISTAWRSSARRTETGQLFRTASRSTSCRKASRPSCSRRTCAATSCSTPVNNVDGAASSIVASSANENVRPNDAATVANWRADSDMRASRPRMPWLTRSGRRFSISSAWPSCVRTRCSSRSPSSSSTRKNGLPPASRAISSSSESGSAPSVSATTCSTAGASRGCRSIRTVPSAISWSNAARTGAGDSSGRAASSQTIGSDARRLGSDLKAATVPASAHCRSSSHTSIGVSNAARSSDVWRSSSIQYRPSGAARRSASDARLRIGGDPPNSARNIGASSAAPSPGSAALPPTASDRRLAIRMLSSIRRLLPIPDGASIRITDPDPVRSRARHSPIAANSRSRPRSVGLAATPFDWPRESPVPSTAPFHVRLTDMLAVQAGISRLKVAYRTFVRQSSLVVTALRAKNSRRFA